MSEGQEFSFGDKSVASAYDKVLVPVLFEPWANRLIDEYGPWEGRRVLDIATGSGIFAQLVARQVGPAGGVLGIDINGEMLDLARERCAETTAEMKFIKSPAYPLEIPTCFIDYVVCQQGFQFFTDKDAAAREIYRVLNVGGKVVITTWRTVAECQYFGSICNALNMIGETDISEMMRLPFDFMPGSQLIDHFKSAGFVNIQLSQQEQDFVIKGGVGHAIEVAYATPIGPKLVALSDERQAEFQKALTELLNELSFDGITMGQMVSNVLSAEK